MTVKGQSMIRRIMISRRRDDAGMALLMVVASMLILSIIVTAALGYAVRDQSESRHDQDYTAALQAANAGVQDYISYVNQHGQAYNTTPALYCANPAMQGGDTSQLTSGSCAWGSTPAWVKVQDLSGTNPIPEYYHYDINTSNSVQSGQVIVTASGRVNKVTRTVQATVTDGGSTDYTYFTDYESQDPQISGDLNNTCRPLNGTTPRHWWEMSGTQQNTAANDGTDGCNINFITGDLLTGPVHTNDDALMFGTPDFEGAFSTSDPACQTATQAQDYSNTCYRSNGSPTPTFNPPPSYVKDWLPPNNTNTLKATAQSLGCVYNGPTRIKFVSTGSMQVWSRYTTSVNAGCGTVSALQSAAGATVPILANLLVFVQNAGPPAPNAACTVGSIGDGLPVANDAWASNPKSFHTGLTADQYCNEGNAFVQGSVNGRVTVAAENDVIITGDTTDAGGLNGDDILGLVALNYIEIYHPVTGLGGNDIGTVPTTFKVQAAVDALNHSFLVQAWETGTHGNRTLSVTGSIAQEFRGTVGTSSGGNTGYLKSYSYDTRLKYGPPPYYPHWTNANWTVTLYGEINPKY